MAGRAVARQGRPRASRPAAPGLAPDRRPDRRPVDRGADPRSHRRSDRDAGRHRVERAQSDLECFRAKVGKAVSKAAESMRN